MNTYKASLSDLQLVAPLFSQYRQFYQLEEDLAGATKFIEERLRKEDSVIFLAINAEKEAMGFVQLYPTFSSLSMKPLWILNDLFVDPRFRKLNVAKNLMNLSEEHARSTGAKGLTLMTAVDNLPAQKLYNSLGWKQVTQFFTFSKSF